VKTLESKAFEVTAGHAVELFQAGTLLSEFMGEEFIEFSMENTISYELSLFTHLEDIFG
jgi:hypothetical protein